MVYILDGYIPDGQAIHHSDSRQVLNLDGGSAVTGQVWATMMGIRLYYGCMVTEADRRAGRQVLDDE
jgi:hypothetical protein